MSLGERLGWLATGMFVGAWIANYINYRQFTQITDQWASQTADDAEDYLRRNRRD